MNTVLITGANKGIGFATAKKFHAEGYNVIITGRNEEKLKGAIKNLGEDVRYIVWDLKDRDMADKNIEKAHSLFGNIDIFINNAGIVTDEDIYGAGFLNEMHKSWDDTIAVNLTGTYFALQAQAKYMIKKSVTGHIVVVCSEMGFRAARDAYAVSKWGVRGMIYGAAKELAKYGIIVNGIAPGETATGILRQKEGVPYKINSPRGERSMPSEIANDIFYLSQTKNIIGAVLNTDGGRSLY